jgi:hypothetical protein
MHSLFLWSGSHYLPKEFLRIRERLNIENMAQLSALLTALSGYGARQQIVRKSADNE